MKLFAALFTGLFGLLWLALTVFMIVAWVKGIILAFSASIVLGIVCIFFEVPFPLFAIVYWLTGTDLAQAIVHFFQHLH